ncbi:hypothetical protein B9479_007758 [Cryptococcus floricola]|uniref:Uncharacterized protein n=1 Tax=Cryptococcus floricola TaxID=2591691 RepID=A0A5D3ANJ4_9TREE|nr:hypothetical protein B9479_007758 [Cryptococcus floricola]
MAEQIDNKQASTFTPIHPFDMDTPKSWGSTIALMNWDTDKIVFSKRSLLEFLKSADVTVGQNFNEIQKLPKYATFGKFSQAATDAAVADLVDAEIGDPTHASNVPSSKATVPRGKTGVNIFPEEYEEEDALSLAPPRDGGDGVDLEVERLEKLRIHVEKQKEGGATIEEVTKDASGNRVSNPPPGFKPTRKVTQAPGGKSSVGSILFGDD